jgi:hypothetical protein
VLLESRDRLFIAGALIRGIATLDEGIQSWYRLAFDKRTDDRLEHARMDAPIVFRLRDGGGRDTCQAGKLGTGQTTNKPLVAQLSSPDGYAIRTNSRSRPRDRLGHHFLLLGSRPGAWLASR